MTGYKTALADYIDRDHLFGRHGITGLDWHARQLLAGVDLTDGNALEVGAGRGLLSLWMLSSGARSVVSLEPEADGSTAGVRDALERHRRALGVSADRWQVEAETFQSYRADRVFRVILLQNSINHLDEDACVDLLEDPTSRRRYHALFEKMASMLEPGGHIVLADCARVNRLAWLGRHSPLNPTIEWHKHHEPETWIAVLREAGLGRVAHVWWHPYYRTRKLAPLINRRAVARWLSSYFVVHARKALTGAATASTAAGS